MHEDLFINDLIEWESDGNSQLIERIIWIDEGYVIAFVLDINSKKGLPEPKKVSEILEAMSEGLAFKQKQDPWARIIREENLTDRDKEYRDKAWEIISSLVVQEPSIYYRNIRGSLVRQVIKSYNEGREKDKLVERTVYGYMRRFWQRGKTKNALIPDFINSSGKGKIRGDSNKKRGRPKKYSYDPEIGEGVNVTEEDRRIFRIAISRFYNNPKENYFTTAYELMVKEFYKEGVRYDENGVRKSILTPTEKIPTITQFKYWYQIEQYDVTKTLISRIGAKKFALENRAILGTSKMETIGPGSRYQIDATVGDVYLVSKYNRNWIIGRPVIYVIIDVFSRMITGFYIGLEGPSWIGAMMALTNVAADKVMLCQEYNIDIAEEQWSCNQMPDAILGDRGELAGMAVEPLIPNLYVRIENAASYRADWKGLVERHFRTIHEYVKPFLPGYVDTDFRQRGARDYRLDSKLDIDQFAEIIIRLIIFHNNKPLNEYERDEAMIADDVPPIPRELWEWGIANRSGRLRSFPEDIVKLNLMPTEKATITAKGIKLRGKDMYYSCDQAEKEQWFEKARSNMLSKSEKSLIVSYDIRNPNFIYLPLEDGRNFEKCFLIDPEGRYINKNFYDIEYMLAYEELQQQKTQGKTLQEKVDLIADIEHIVSKAENMTEAAQDEPLSKSKKVAGIRENRAFEKAKRRENEGFELAKTETPTSTEAVETNNESLKPPKSLQPNHLDILKQKRLERKRGRKE
ncbi:DDE-type integrase/transposase/recombinase [Nostoc sp. 'Peltigera membranacea cyanobiont' N6]|uniref:DDE-type integrase/transposase/recombinase n=1 Tax=Nostoc sp. 'Peltigera membranacea cyanobiont' N6 TaxID=1261031 RepID=UPI000CF30C32|nr:DDE-type integrase/transposase/recombinase [Nostoc sp. 'Peltigera membranacea cyanobiont' N6]AVH67419.1 Tn7 transposition protein B [Nostoc sp. 'Peltigera membranacea cyanobiont' N6]